MAGEDEAGLRNAVALAIGAYAAVTTPADLRAVVLRCLEAAMPRLEAMAEITARVCAARGVTVEDVRGAALKHRFTRVRQEIFWTIYATGRFSLPQVGRYFGRHHSTVYYGIARHVERLTEAA